MYSTIPGYYSPRDFAKEYKDKKGKKGVQPAYIYRLIKQEIKEQGSTDIDVVEIGKSYFVRYHQD